MADKLDKSGDRPAHEVEEIEVTPAMIEAGANAFLDCHNLRYDTAESAAYEIFTAMVSFV